MALAPSLRMHGIHLCLLTCTLPRVWSSEGRDGIGRALGECVDLSGHYVSEYNVHLDVTQTKCSVFVDPPGENVGIVRGKEVSITGNVRGTLVGNDIHFSNGATWIKTALNARPKSGGHQAGPCDTASLVNQGALVVQSPAVSSVHSPAVSNLWLTTVAPVPVAPSQATTHSPEFWWAVGTGLAIASAGAIAGGAAAGIAEMSTTPKQIVVLIPAEIPIQAVIRPKNNEQSITSVTATENVGKHVAAMAKDMASRHAVASEDGKQPHARLRQQGVSAGSQVEFWLGGIAIVCCLLLVAGFIAGWSHTRSKNSTRSISPSDSLESDVAEEEALVEEE